MGKGVSELETEHRAFGTGFKTVWIKGPDALAVVKKITTVLKGDTQLVDVTAHKMPIFDWKTPLPVAGGPFRAPAVVRPARGPFCTTNTSDGET